MSRSRKKVPGFKDHPTPLKKRIAAKAVRNYDDEVSEGGSFKKLYESYDICDWKSLYFNKPDKKRLEDDYGERTYKAWQK